MDWKGLAAAVLVATLLSLTVRATRVPENWFVDSTNAEAYVEGVTVDPALGNRQVAYIRSTRSKAPGFTVIAKRLDAVALRGKRLVVKAQMRSDGVEDKGSLWILALGGQGQDEIRTDSPRSFWHTATDVVGTTAWHEARLATVVAREATTLLVGFALRGDGTITMTMPEIEATEGPVKPERPSEPIALGLLPVSPKPFAFGG
jgi:hypothetical protein